EPLVRDARELTGRIGAAGEVILLGSIATGKYIEPLLATLGKRLRFPADFVGRGDMSRGGLLLRCARAGIELTYVGVGEVVRHGCCRQFEMAPGPVTSLTLAGRRYGEVAVCGSRQQNVDCY